MGVLEETIRKRENFDGQLRIVIPQKILDSVRESPLLNNLYLYSMGFYPKARFHHCERPEGSPQHILIYCVMGRGWVEINKRKHFIQQGDCIFIPKDVAHKYGADELEPWSIYWIHFLGELGGQFMEILKGDGPLQYKAIPHSVERINLFRSMYAAMESGYSKDNINYINMSLWYFLSSFIYPNNFQRPVDNENRDIIELSIHYMQDNLHGNINLKLLADHVNISESRYLALFKKKTGYSPMQYYNQIKVQKACQMLHFTDLQVKEISYELGISDTHYFSRLFRNIMGMSPVEYRSTNRIVQ